MQYIFAELCILQRIWKNYTEIKYIRIITSDQGTWDDSWVISSKSHENTQLILTAVVQHVGIFL